MNKNAIYLILSFILGANQAWSTPMVGQTAKVAPMTALSWTPSGFRASFQLPCSARFLGVVTARERGNLELGAAYTVGLLRCTYLPRAFTVDIGWLNPTLAASARPLSKLRQKGIWRITEGLVTQIYSERARTAVDFVYPSACGRLALPVFQPTTTALVTIAALEYFAGAPDPECRTFEKLIPLSKIVDLAGVSQYQPYARAAKDLDRAYFVTLAKLVDFSIERQAGYGLAVTFKRHCNEVPIGLVMSPVYLRQGLRHADVGVLVGHYYNGTCLDEAQPGQEVERMHIQALEFSTDIALSPIDPDKYSERLRLRTPTVSDMELYGQNQGLVLDYISDCSKQVGAVYHFSPEEPLSVGVVEDLNKERCNGKLKRVSLLQPFMDRIDRRNLAPIYPLRLQGLSGA